MIVVDKTNILVVPIVEHAKPINGLLIDDNSFKRNVDTRLNAGRVVAVSPKISGININDVVGYSTYDGVDIKHNGVSYILLSERETQAIILAENVERIKFRDHNRDDESHYDYRKTLVQTDTLIIKSKP